LAELAEIAVTLEQTSEKILEKWKEKVDSAVVFVCAGSTLLCKFLLKHMFKAGLFSAVGAVCLTTSSYKGSLQNPGKETVKLIAQLFQHLVNISDGMPLERIAIQRSEPPRRTPSEVTVNLNITWFSGVVICIGCAAFVTLIQQWERRRSAHCLRGGRPYERTRLQAFLFGKHGTFYVNMHRVYQLLGVFMHFSLLSYCVGLIAFIFRIDQKSISKALTLGHILCCFLVYAITMYLPFYFFDCTHGTPFTVLTWRLYHVFMFGVFSTFLGIADLPHTLSTLGSRTCRRVRDPSWWRNMLKKRVNKHRRRLLCGLERRANRYATTRAYADKVEEDFNAWALEFFNTYALSNAEETILPLMSPTDHIFGIRLHRLLKICILGNSVLTEDPTQRKIRLRVCLECLWCLAKAYSLKSAASLPHFVPIPNTDTIYRLQTKRDPTAAIIAQCFCALVAKELAADINSRYPSADVKLEPLSAILGRTRTEVEDLLLQPGAIGLTNIVSLTSAVIKTLSSGSVPPEVLSIFQSTVDILLTEDFLDSLDADLPQDLVSSFHQTTYNAKKRQAPDWLWGQLWPISARLYAVSYKRGWQDGRKIIFLGRD
jgi:hypothetical protein